MPLQSTSLVRAVYVAVILVASAVPAGAQRAWVQVAGPHVSVLSDAGEGQARSIAWQFEQVREAVTRTFPWIRADTALPLLVLAARNEGSMRALAPAFWEKGQGSSLASVSQHGHDRIYILLRADARVEDREGINPYQSAYWAYAAAALGDTSAAFPRWLSRGLSSLISNTLVRDNEVQVGRVLPQHLERLRSRGRIPLTEVVNFPSDGEPSLDRLTELDAHAWAFVHFLAFKDQGAHTALLNAYVRAILSGADPAASLASTIGDVARFETEFAIYIDRSLFGYVRYETSARVTREGLTVREVPAGESAALRASLHVAMARPNESKALIAEAEKAGPEGVADEARALAAEAEGRDGELTALLERAATRPGASWYVPYRLATRLPGKGTDALERMQSLLLQATARNAAADQAWALLGEVQANLGQGDAAIASVRRAIQLRPTWSAHRISLARVLGRLDRGAEALQAAGAARALARTPFERDQAQRLLGELAKTRLAAEASAPTPAKPAVTPVDARAAVPPPAAEAPSPPGTERPAPPAQPGAPDPPAAAPSTRPPSGPAPADVSSLINRCLSARETCTATVPAVAADCEASRATSRSSCAFAGFALDVGLGVTADPARAGNYYRIACALRDQRSCVRLASLQASGRGVPRDVPAALAVLEPACTGGSLEACGRLALALLNRGQAGDVDRARTLLKEACDGGDEASCTLLKKLPSPK